MSVENRPGILPSKELWDLCIEIGKRRNEDPYEVLKDLIFCSQKLAVMEVNNAGKTIHIGSDGKIEEVEIFTSNGNGTSKHS